MPTIVAPRFSEEFRRLCQAVAIDGAGRSDQVVDGLLVVAMVYDERPWHKAEDWVKSIRDLFSLGVSEYEVTVALRRAVKDGRIEDKWETSTPSFGDPGNSRYVLSDKAKKDASERIDEGYCLEGNIRESWIAKARMLIPEASENDLWLCLIGYARRAFLSLGLDAVKLFDASVDGFTNLATDESPKALLKSAMHEARLPVGLLPQVSQAIAEFFDGQDADRVRYISELANGTYNFLALSVDPKAQRTLLDNLPTLSIFVDTNVIYSLLGAHEDDPGTPVSELFNVLRQDRFPFKVYYHEKTLRELDRTLSGIGYRLGRERYSQARSRELLAMSHRMSSIEIRYHKTNGKAPTTVQDFLGKFANLRELLKGKGLVIFKDPDSSASDAAVDDSERGELVAEYNSFLKGRGKDKEYSVLDHDIAIWRAAARKQRPSRKGPLPSGSLVVSADGNFRNFDREILSPRYATRWIVTRPDTLLQALRPFSASAQQSDAVFTQVFATTEFRGIGRYDDLRRMASVLANNNYNMTERDATRKLANSMLQTRLEQLSQADSASRRTIDKLERQNEALQQERDEVLQWAREADQSMIQARKESLSIQSKAQAEGNTELAAGMKSVIGKIDQSASQTQIIIGRFIVGNSNEYLGDYYHNDGNQVGAQGPNAQAHHFTQLASGPRPRLDLPALALDLEALKQALRQSAATQANYQSIGEVQAAQDAASAGDQVTIWGHLKRAGTWALGVAKEIGAEVAAAAIDHALGFGA